MTTRTQKLKELVAEREAIEAAAKHCMDKAKQLGDAGQPHAGIALVLVGGQIRAMLTAGP